MTPSKNNIPLTISEFMLSFIQFGNQISGIIHVLASDFRRYPHGVDITEFQAKGKSGKK